MTKEPKWIVNRKKYINKYHREKLKTIRITLSRANDADCITIWKNMPEKTNWMRGQLRKYAEEHPELLEEHNAETE